MVPKQPMLATKNGFLSALRLVPLAGLLLICGCTPPGPRALLKGEKLIQEEKWEEAILTLQKAAQLLPNNAQAWNHLGLAYHGNHQPELALKCYKSALWLDRNLAAARYNLGCLLLEQNDVPGALEQLTSFTFLQPSSPEGWIKMGTAQMRSRRPDLAEKNFKTALDLRSNDPEAFNNLGLIHLQRKRTQEAMAYFTSALVQNTNYGPALLNLGVLSQQNPSTRGQALQYYRRYLALQPKPLDWEKVQAVSAQLDLELNPPPLQLNPIAHAPVKTNAPLPVTNALAQVRISPTKPPPVQTVVTQIQIVSITQMVHAVTSAPPRLAQQVSAPAEHPALIINKPVAVAENPVTKPAPKPSNLEISHVQADLVVRPPPELAPVTPAALNHPRRTGFDEQKTVPPADQTSIVGSSATTGGKTTFLTKLNPFGGKAKPVGEPAPSSKEKVTSVDLSTHSLPVTLPEPVPVARYAYISPEKPGSGLRKEAEKFYIEGVKLHKAGSLRDAVANYQKAIQWDPSYFEACFNLGLAAYERGQMKQSLAAYEYALVLNPDSVDARYNFALALKQAGYPQDAAEELLKVVRLRPNEARGHYSLGNVYANQLKQMPDAREHYQKALELNPSHPQASEIRFWLAHNLQ
jgi:tetratricopeptide (TPR) repeat protein